MPQGKYISFGVFYADSKKLPEYNIRDKVYSEVNLHGPQSFFIEEDEQKYPVVPFYLEILRNCDPVVWLVIYLDGQLISNRPLCQRKFRCDGVKVQTEIRELLFSLPKIMESQEKKNPLGEFAGTIRLKVYEAQCVGKKESPVFRVDPAHTSCSKERVLQHLTKKDIPHNMDTVGRIVSREGRPTLYVTRTGQFKTLWKYSSTQNLLEELVLYYRPRISSHAPSNMPEIKQEKEQANSPSPPPRVPLGDVANTVAQQQRASDEASQSSGKAPLPEEQSTTGLQGGQGSGDSPRDEVMMEAEDATQERPAGSLGTGEQPAGSVSAQIPVENIKTRESSAFMIPPQNIKKRESSTFMMIKAENIKKRESSAFMMIQPENIKRRESSSLMMIPPQTVKTRESCGGPLIPPEQIKQQPNEEMASSSVKEESAESQWVMDQYVVLDSADHATSSSEQQECQWLTEEFILIDDSSDDEELEIGLEEKSIVYMGTEYHVDDDVQCMGDEDCCVLDVSNHVSVLEIDDTHLDL